MKWINNLMSYTKNGEKGKCPFCGSDHVEVIETSYGRESLTFICNDCKQSCHIDGKIMKGKKNG